MVLRLVSGVLCFEFIVFCVVYDQQCRLFHTKHQIPNTKY